MESVGRPAIARCAGPWGTGKGSSKQLGCPVFSYSRSISMTARVDHTSLDRARQKESFKAICPMRGSRPLRIAPNPAPFTDVAGPFRFTRFEALKNSARNCKPQRSLIEKCLAIPMSQLNNPGPRSAPFAILPNVPTAGRPNAEGTRESTQGALFRHAPGP